jgi:NAD(P)-dependent dehydrogenase (short-subunit alcohol dehydrogenase family)
MTRRNGKTAVVTASTDGVGRLVAKRLGETGFRVLVHGSDQDRGERVGADIQSDGGTADFLRADLSTLPSARGALPEAVFETTDRLAVLINNAGIGSGGAARSRQTSGDGQELRFALSYLAGFALTHLLRRSSWPAHGALAPTSRPMI